MPCQISDDVLGWPHVVAGSWRLGRRYARHLQDRRAMSRQNLIASGRNICGLSSDNANRHVDRIACLPIGPKVAVLNACLYH